MTTPIIPQTTYSRYSREYVDPSAAKLEELMRRFAVPMEDFSRSTATVKTQETKWTPQQNALAWLSSYGPSEQMNRAPAAQPRPTGAQSDFSARGWAGRLTRGSGQVRPSEMSGHDLMAEADALGISGTMVMPRPVLEKAVETMRKQKQATNTPGVTNLRRVGAFAIGAVESLDNIVSNFLGEDNVPDMVEARRSLAQLKAKLRLSTTEQQAADQDRAMAVGTFVGPFVPQWAMFEGINATMQGVAKAPMVGAAAAKVLTGWRGGALSAGVMNVLWNSQYKDMPTLPDADLWEAGVKGLGSENALDQLLGGAQIAGATLNSRVGSLLFDMGLGALLGRWQQQGATALPQAAQPQVPPPSGGGLGPGPGLGPTPTGPMGPSMPPLVGPPGPLAASPLGLVNTADGVVGPMWRPPTAVEVAEDVFGWKPASSDVAPSNMAADALPKGSTEIPVVRSTGFHFGQEVQPTTPAPSVPTAAKPRQFTAEELVPQFQSGDMPWMDAVPVPAAGQNEVPNWQNLPAARLARASGTVLTKPDGSLIALVHEGAAFDGAFRPSEKKQLLTGRGAYFRDRLDTDYAAYSEKVGYGVRRSAEAQAEYLRISELRDGLQTQVDNMESALRLSGKKPSAVVERIAELRLQMQEYNNKLAAMGPNVSVASHPVFAVVKKPFYFESRMSQDKVEELLNVIRTNDTFENLRPSLTQVEGEFYELFNRQYNGQPVEPLGSEIYARLGQLWKDTPEGAKTLYDTNQLNDLLQATGYDAIHNLGGVRAGAADKMHYNAWNILDPERQIIRVFAPPPMAADIAEQAAVQLTKQAAVMESPVVMAAAEKASLSDVDVAVANIATHPYGVQVVRAVKDPGALMQQIAAKNVGIDGVGASSVRIVPRALTPGGVESYDVMISTGQPITDAMAADYAKHGVFEGMQGVDVKGSDIEVLKVFVAQKGQKSGAVSLTEGKTYLVVRKLDNKTIATKEGVKAQTRVMGVEKFLEHRATRAPFHAQDPAAATLVSDYMDFAMERLGLEAEDLLSTDALRQMPKLFSEFAAAKNLPPASRYVMGQLVDNEMQTMARELMGEEFKAVDDALADALEALPGERLVDVQQMAAVRGLSATREQGTPRWVLKGPNATRWIMEDEDAAMAFLQKYDAQVADLSPGAPIIPEVARSGMPDTHFVMPPTMAEELVRAESSEVLARAGIDAAKIEQNMERDLLGAQYGATPGPAQPASALSPLPAVVRPAASAQPMRGQPPLPPPPPPTQPPAPAAGGAQPPSPQGGGALRLLQPQLQAVARNVMSIERELTSFSMQHVLPSSYFFDRMEKLLFEAGAPALRPGQQMETMRTLISTFYNESEPHIAKLTKLMDRVSSGVRRRGEVWRALDLPLQPTANLPVSRAQYMQQRNFSAAEQQVVGDVEQLLVDVFQGNKALADRTWLELKAYVNIVEQNIVAGAPNPYRVPQGMFSNIQHFVEHAERRQLRLEVPETGTIMYEFLRSHYWSKNVKPEWDQMQAGWRALARWQDQRGERVLRPIAEHVLTWMNGVENGFMPKVDPVVNALQSGLSAMGVPLTKQETMQLISGTMSSAYRALLGWNPASIVRDSLQFIGAAPWTGFKNLTESVQEVVGSKGAAARKAVWQRALNEGWTELGIPPQPGTNVHQSAMLPGAPPLQTGFSPAEESRRELAQSISDFFRDMTPAGLRSIEGTKLDPLWAYTNQGVVFRVVVANAAAKRFDQVVARPLSINAALREMGADVLSFAQRRNIEEAMIAGKVDEARKVYTNTVTNTVMNRYGLKEGAVGNHTVFGRVFTQLGGHSSHQLASMMNLVEGGFTGSNVGEKALNFVSGKASPTLYRMTGIMGMLAGALYMIQQQTGWNTMKMHPLNWAANPNGVLGGPLREPLLSAAEGIGAAPGLLFNEDPRQPQLEAARALTQIPGSFMRMAGAPAAAYRLVSGVAGAAKDGDAETMARFLLTGDRRPQFAVEQKQGVDNLLEYLEGKRGTGAF